jgi:CheY-like chemotaxis protein
MIVSDNHPTILLVCSSAIMREVLKESLQNERYNVLAVNGLGGAVDRLKEVSPDLLIVRPYLDNIDGHDAAVYLRTKNPGMRVLILSGTIDDDRLINQEVLQSFQVFPKPFTVAEFIEKVEQVLAMPI